MKNFLLILAVLSVFISCNRSAGEDEESSIIGPSLDDIYGPFNVLQEITITDANNGQKNVDFQNNGEVTFTGRFSKNVEWEIHIVGQKSGAEKVISERSKVIDLTNSVWDGTTTNLPMFKTEPCLAYVTVPSETYTDTIGTITVDSVKTYDGFVLADFEEGTNTGWEIFFQSGADMFRDTVVADTAAQGNAFFRMAGEVTFDFLIGLIHMTGDDYGDGSETSFPLNDNPNEVYFNVMMLQPEAITNGFVLFQFREDDNEDGRFQEGAEDMYSIEIAAEELVNGSGWQLISVPYSDLTVLENGQPVDPAGNGLREPNKLFQVSMLFLADPTSGYSERLMDYLIFTEGGPLVP